MGASEKAVAAVMETLAKHVLPDGAGSCTCGWRPSSPHVVWSQYVEHRLTVDGEPGTLVSFPGQYLGIRFDRHPKVTKCAHPTWRVARIEAA